MHRNTLRWATAGLITAGVSLWLVNWWAARPLFLDEANVARNLFDRTFAGLFTPLDHRQYAPPLYLVMAKACGEIFGYGERSLRLPALLGGLAAVAGLWWAGRTLRLGWWSLLPLALLFVSPVVLRYVAEVKPYGLDLGLAAIFIAWGLRQRQPGAGFMFAGAIAIWASLPLIFVLAAVGLRHFIPLLFRSSPRTSGRAPLIKWLTTGALWVSSFAALYWLVLAPSVGTKYLNLYHDEYFFPVSGGMEELHQAGRLLLSFLRLPFGFTVAAIAVGCAVFLVGLYHRRNLWLLLPLGLALAASVSGHYSLLPRLLLFALPGWWLLAAIQSARAKRHWRWLLLAVWLVISGGTNVARHYLSPQTFSDSQRLVTEIAPGYHPILHHGAVPAYDYYHRIHPAHDRTRPPAREGNIRSEPSPDKRVLLYDVMTQGNIRDAARRDSIWAAERGCRVRSIAMFRAKALYLDCPAE